MKVLKQVSDGAKETAEAIDRYWFGFGSPTALGLFRIFMSTLVVINFLMLLVDWDAWFSERGFVPSWLAEIFMWPRVPLWYRSPISLPRMGLLNAVTDPRIVMLVYGLTLVAGIFSIFGLWTRVSTCALAVGVVSLHMREPAILHGGDTILRLSVLYLAIAPSGKACSVDRLIGLWKGRVSPAPVLVSMWPQRLISFNIALLYLTTTWLKWGGGLWQNGTATWYPARLAEFFRFPVPRFINELPFVYLTTYGTLATEFSMATLVFFKPLRKYVLLAAMFMHADIEYSMNIPLFSYLIVAGYICFYDGEEIAAWAERRGERKPRWHVNIRLPQGMRLKPNAVGLLDSIDPFKLLHYLPGSEDHWVASRHDGSTLPVSRAIATRSPGSWIFALLPNIWPRILTNSLEPIPETAPAPVQQPAKQTKHKTTSAG